MTTAFQQGRDLVASHRATTSSRRPGHVYRGVVYTVQILKRTCEDCGGVTTELVMPGFHAPHWVAGRLLNCAGLELATI